MGGGLELPPSFLENAQEGFAGGIELSFTSTTTSAEVAFKYSGRGRGSILVLDFNMSSRGASISFLSQFPHEEEHLFPPFTSFQCTDHSERHPTARGPKRLLLVTPGVSTRRPDTSALLTPETRPPSRLSVATSSDCAGPGACLVPTRSRSY